MTKSIFKSHEPLNNNKLYNIQINYPNEFVIIIYIFVSILFLNYSDYYGSFILISLSISSLLWWGISNKNIQKWDTISYRYSIMDNRIFVKKYIY